MFATGSFLFLLLFIYIPVTKIPGNSFSFQISIFTFKDWFSLIALSLLSSLSLTMNVFVFDQENKSRLTKSSFGRGSLGIIYGFIGSIFGPTASCASCVGSIFGFLGVGAVIFMIRYQTYILLTFVILILFSIYYTSLRVLGICKRSV